MRLSKKQKSDLETILYFLHPSYKDMEITDKDIEDFFANSERGYRRGDEDSLMVRDGYHALLDGKRWRGIHMHEMYEPGVLEGSMPYYVILGGADGEPVPRSVVEFMKKEMFRGIDANLIENCYQDILAEVGTKE